MSVLLDTTNRARATDAARGNHNEGRSRKHQTRWGRGHPLTLYLLFFCLGFGVRVWGRWSPQKSKHFFVHQRGFSAISPVRGGGLAARLRLCLRTAMVTREALGAGGAGGLIPCRGKTVCRTQKVAARGMQGPGKLNEVRRSHNFIPSSTREGEDQQGTWDQGWSHGVRLLGDSVVHSLGDMDPIPPPEESAREQTAGRTLAPL